MYLEHAHNGMLLSIETSLFLYLKVINNFLIYFNRTFVPMSTALHRYYQLKLQEQQKPFDFSQPLTRRLRLLRVLTLKNTISKILKQGVLRISHRQMKQY